VALELTLIAVRVLRPMGAIADRLKSTIYPHPSLCIVHCYGTISIGIISGLDINVSARELLATFTNLSIVRVKNDNPK